jgi:hypothetical protein
VRGVQERLTPVYRNLCQLTKVKIVGAIIPGHGRWIIAVPPGLKSGSALQVTIVHLLVLEIQSRLRAKGLQLPRELWVQSDNTVRECKNRRFLAYLKWLVHMGIFDKVSCKPPWPASGCQACRGQPGRAEVTSKAARCLWIRSRL